MEVKSKMNLHATHQKSWRRGDPGKRERRRIKERKRHHTWGRKTLGGGGTSMERAVRTADARKAVPKGGTKGRLLECRLERSGGGGLGGTRSRDSAACESLGTQLGGRQWLGIALW